MNMDTEYSTNHTNNLRSRERHSSRRDRSRSRSRNRHSSRRDRSRSRERHSSRRDRSRSRERHSSRRDRSRSYERNKKSEIEKLKLDIEIAKKTKELAEIQSSILSSQINTSDLIKSAMNFGKIDNSVLSSLPPLPPPPPQFLTDYTFKQPINEPINPKIFSYQEFLKEIDILFDQNSILIGSKVPRRIWPLKLDGTNYSNLKELADDFGIKNEYRGNLLFLINDNNNKKLDTICPKNTKCYNKYCRYIHSYGYIPRPIIRCRHENSCFLEKQGMCTYSHPNDKYWNSCIA